MLIYFYKPLLLEGENSTMKRKHFWSKPYEVRQKIHCFTAISGVCDEAALKSEVERLTAEQLETSGWGKKFSGWQRAVTAEEAAEIAKIEEWDSSLTVPSDKVKVEYINTWTMDRILKNLTGEQFAQFCRENDIPLKGI